MNTFSHPQKIIQELDIQNGDIIADFGSGTGIYSLLLAKQFPQSKIYAIDIKKDMVERLSRIIEEEQIPNIHVVWGDIDNKNGSRLRDASVHFVLLVNTLFQLADKKEALKEIYRVLKPHGQLLILDWSDSYGSMGPHEDHVVKESTARLLADEQGFVFEHAVNAGEHHYGFVVRKNI